MQANVPKQQPHASQQENVHVTHQKTPNVMGRL